MQRSDGRSVKRNIYDNLWQEIMVTTKMFSSMKPCCSSYKSGKACSANACTTPTAYHPLVQHASELHDLFSMRHRRNHDNCLVKRVSRSAQRHADLLGFRGYYGYAGRVVDLAHHKVMSYSRSGPLYDRIDLGFGRVFVPFIFLVASPSRTRTSFFS